MKIILSFILVLTVTGCATNNYLVPDEYRLTPEKSGYIVGTISSQKVGENKNRNGASSLLFRKIGSDASANISVNRHLSGFTKWDFIDTDKQGKIYKLAIDPGEYEVYGVYFYYNNGQVTRTYKSKKAFSVPFTIEEGNTYYFGELVSYGLWGENIFGISILGGGYFELFENKEHDFPLLKTKFPELQEQEIISLNLDINQPPFISSK